MDSQNSFFKKCNIQRNEELGRHTVAAVDIKAGETLLLEQPFLILADEQDLRCANCYKHTKQRCQKCQIFPLCEACNAHTDFDCELLATPGTNNINLTTLQKHSKALGVLKFLLMREKPQYAEQFAQFLALEAHLDQRRKTEIWQENEVIVVTPILSSNIANVLTNKVDAELLQQIIGIFDVNCFEIRAPDEGCLRAIYLNAALLPHDCLANCAIAVDHQRQLKLYATLPISEGSLVTNCYTNVLLGTSERKESLRLGKYFECKCERCMDPTEFGSHMSSLNCTGNCEGNVLWNEGKWECNKCKRISDKEHVEQLLERAKEEIFHAKDDIYRYELLLSRLSKFLHKNHYLLVDLKQNIASILRSIITDAAQPPGKKVFERKVRLCQELLNVLCIIQPGISRLRAIAMYELSSTYAELCRLRFNEQEITEQQLKEQLERVEQSMRESVRMLLYEPPNTPEGSLARNMMQELKELQEEMKQLNKDVEHVDK